MVLNIVRKNIMGVLDIAGVCESIIVLNIVLKFTGIEAASCRYSGLVSETF